MGTSRCQLLMEVQQVSAVDGSWWLQYQGSRRGGLSVAKGTEWAAVDSASPWGPSGGLLNLLVAMGTEQAAADSAHRHGDRASGCRLRVAMGTEREAVNSASPWETSHLRGGGAHFVEKLEGNKN
ncbi:unnamed protein product [Lampetra planeri]